VKIAYRRGFTLIELLIVILIIAVMAAVVVPSYLRFLGHARFRTKVRAVQDLFAYAREQAVLIGAPVTLSYDKQSESFTVTLPTPPAEADQPVALSGSDAGEDANAQASPATPPRTISLDADQSIGNYSLSASPLTTASPNATVPGSNSSSGQSGPNDLHFQGDGTVEGLEMLITQSDGAHAQLTLSPATARLTLDVGKSI
jgi:prepilin-type N-terminal cleavage/methylation domain-containing protein